MANFTVTISPSAVNSIGAKWCIVDKTGWLDSAENTTVAVAGDVIHFKYVESYLSPTAITITSGMISALGTTATYTSTQWLAAWGPPMCGCMFRGQAILAGKYFATEQTFPSDSRIVRWSEIGAFRFLGAGANTLKNEAGFTYMDTASDECVMAAIPLKEKIVMYSTMGIKMLRPVASPAPAFEIIDFLPGTGILHPLAVAGSLSRHVLISKLGDLIEIYTNQYGQQTHKVVGYRHIFAPMQENFSMTTGIGVIVVTYNPDEDEWYISNGTKSYVYNNGLTEIGVAISSYINLKGTLISSELFNSDSSKTLGNVISLMNSDYVYLETDIFDLDISGIKTVNQVEVCGGFGLGATTLVMIKWRNSRSEEFRDTPWRRCSPSGVGTVTVSGADFKVCVMTTPVKGVVINKLIIEWQLSDKTSVRGNYVGSASA
jgi:hypothetical protein